MDKVIRACPACGQRVSLYRIELEHGGTRHARCAITLRKPDTTPYRAARAWYALRRTLGVPAEAPLGRR